MVAIIQKGADKNRIQKALESLHVRKGFQAFQYCGKVKLAKHPLEIQKKLRDEWA